MITPDMHPHADDLARFLVATFGKLAPARLAALQMLLGNSEVMEFLEAFGFVHESTFSENSRTQDQREGMRTMVLHIHAARNISQHDLLQLVNSTGEQS
jgi:hypothetical protein